MSRCPRACDSAIAPAATRARRARSRSRARTLDPLSARDRCADTTAALAPFAALPLPAAASGGRGRLPCRLPSWSCQQRARGHRGWRSFVRPHGRSGAEGRLRDRGVLAKAIVRRIPHGPDRADPTGRRSDHRLGDGAVGREFCGLGRERQSCASDSTPGSRPQQQRRRRLRRWLLRRVSDSHGRLQIGPDEVGSKHTGGSRNRGTAGPRSGRSRRWAGERRGQLRKWRTAGPLSVSEPALHSCWRGSSARCPYGQREREKCASTLCTISADPVPAAHRAVPLADADGRWWIDHRTL